MAYEHRFALLQTPHGEDFLESAAFPSGHGAQIITSGINTLNAEPVNDDVRAWNYALVRVVCRLKHPTIPARHEAHATRMYSSQACASACGKQDDADGADSQLTFAHSNNALHQVARAHAAA